MSQSQFGKLSIDVLRKMMQIRTAEKGFESVFKGAQVLSGGEGKCQCELKITEDMLNMQGFLHGGVTATLVDSVSTIGFMTTGTGAPGVSLELSVSYFKPIPLHESIIVDSKTLSYGRNIAVGTVDITSKSTGKLLALGRHTKFMGNSNPSVKIDKV